MQKRVREPGLEPGSSRWQRPIVPLDHSRCIEGLPHFLSHEEQQVGDASSVKFAVHGKSYIEHITYIIDRQQNIINAKV